jgi:hypothetical protein
MEHPLEAIDWRLERADEHLAALDRERRAFRDQKNGRVVGEFESDTSTYVFRFDGQLPDPRIGLIVGEFAHNLRTALDHLAWQLVLLRGGSPTRSTEFPIEKRRKWYERRLKRGALRGMSADDRAAIEQVQPYQAGECAADTYLALLAWLNNVDKHRFLHIGCAMAIKSPIRVSYGSEGEDAGLFPWNPIPVKDVRKILDVDYVSPIGSEDRTELVRVRFEPAGPDPQMKMHGDAPVEVALSDPEHALILRDLHAIRQSVGVIVDGFRPRFEVAVGPA